MGRFFYLLIKIVLLLTLPFILLIRGAVYLYEQYQFNPWVCLGLGMLATAVLLAIYFSVFYGRLTGRWGESAGGFVARFRRRSFFALLIVLGYSLYGLLYLSNTNAKAPEVRKEYTSLHPILRIGISTVVFVDRKLIITDANRVPEDYRKMGLKTKKHSLHYRQSSGFVHAVDIRTNGRSELRNKLLSFYFKLMGLNVLRHVGTDDHLHISISSKDRPGAI